MLSSKLLRALALIAFAAAACVPAAAPTSTPTVSPSPEAPTEPPPVTATSTSPPEPPAPDLPPQPGQTGAIYGTVWRDLCVPGQGAAPGAGCVEDEYGLLLADGAIDPTEEGISGIFIQLNPRACDLPGLIAQATTTTGSDGAFAFTRLEPGVYCVVIDPFHPINLPILGDGRWTYPGPFGADGVARIEVNFPGSVAFEVNAGWEDLPAP